MADSAAAEKLDVAVIGAGQAGLAIGHYLEENNRSFVILERGLVGETWRSQRWDSFVVNTPNWMSTLPGSPYQGEAVDGFSTREEWVAYLEAYAGRLAIPVRTGHEVDRVSAALGRDGFLVAGVDGDDSRFGLEAKAVVVASGILNAPKIPSLSRDLPIGPLQLHAAGYRSPEELPEGSIVVIGSAQSGCQIAEDLLGASRTVYLCTSRVGRFPRRYRGRDVLEWLREMGFWDVEVGDLEDPAVTLAPQPQISGVGRYGHTLSLQQLARDGAILMGRLIGFEDGALITDDRLVEYADFADEFSSEIKAEIDTYISDSDINAPPPELDPADLPFDESELGDGLDRLDLLEAGVGTVIWCTGFTADFGWLELPVLDDVGRPMHTRGVSPVPGIYFLGFPWLHSRKSGVILGIEEDAGFIARAIEEYLGVAELPVR